MKNWAHVVNKLVWKIKLRAVWNKYSQKKKIATFLFTLKICSQPPVRYVYNWMARVLNKIKLENLKKRNLFLNKITSVIFKIQLLVFFCKFKMQFEPVVICNNAIKNTISWCITCHRYQVYITLWWDPQSK